MIPAEAEHIQGRRLVSMARAAPPLHVGTSGGGVGHGPLPPERSSLVPCPVVLVLGTCGSLLGRLIHYCPRRQSRLAASPGDVRVRRSGRN